MAKQILFNDEARKALKKGIDKLSEAVRMTLGPRGRAVVVEKSYGAPQVTFDGVTVAKEIELQDKFEGLGADLIKQAADKTNDNVGDGTTTSVVLAHAIISEGDKAIQEKGFNVIQLVRKLEAAIPEVIKGLENQREVINDNAKIKEVASLSAKDQEIGKLIAEVMGKVGKEGVVTIEDSNTVANSYEIVEGMQFDRGYISPYMITNADRMETALEDPYILITDKKISSIKEILPVLEKIMESGKKELVIIADDLEGEALATLIVNKLRGILNILAVKAPGFGDRRKEMLEDIAAVTGGSFITEELARKLESADLNSLGHAAKVIATKDNTVIVGGRGKKTDIDARVNQIKSQLKKTDSDFDKEKLQERLGKLAGGVAVIKVGAPTESAQKEMKQRVEDAVSATRAAMEEGIVPGGGMALLNVSLSIKKLSEGDEIQKVAGKIVRTALESPIRAILENSGESVDTTLGELIRKKESVSDMNERYWKGFNADTNKIADLKSAGIIDPLKVTKQAFINAMSVASNYLMTGAAVTEIPEKNPPAGGMPPMGGMGMGM
ncbi:MAG: chaperonin GroEL [Candidatus Colwellbacteria bacterium]|nr:chaperonin GroEL [Candidatus Colwellbacteria bacterium]